MRILILGAKGFIGSRLSTLSKRKNFEVLEFDKDNTVDELLSLLKQADYVVHLAGINRPLTKEEFYRLIDSIIMRLEHNIYINQGFIQQLEELKKFDNEDKSK